MFVVGPTAGCELVHNLPFAFSDASLCLPDGEPPEPRAGYAQDQAEFEITVESVTHLPRSKMPGLDLFVSELTVQHRTYKTKVKTAQDGSCLFSTSFVVQHLYTHT